MTIQKPTAIDWLIGGGEMGELIRSMDWSTTPLGAIKSWSQSLRTAVSICLNSRFPMVIWWGRDLVLLYNDAWQPILGNKHPAALGRPGREVWAEMWEIIGAQLGSVLETGQATWSDDLLLPAFRYGYLEEAYFTYSYSPIFIEDGSIGGAFTAVAETTQRVLGERRMVTLRLLAAQAGEAKTIEQACRITLETVADNPEDIPFAALYRLNGDQTEAVLHSSTLQDPSIAVPTQVSLAPTQPHPWLFSSVVQHQQPVLVDHLVDTLGKIPAGVLSVPLQQALLLPVLASRHEEVVGILVVGVNPGRILDDDYSNFFKMVTGHIATAIAYANAYEGERKRAEALAEIDRAKTAFFSNVSHEFRTPLTLMLSPLEDTIANLDGTIPPQEHEQLQLVQRNGMRLLKLVNSLLDFSRIEAGRVQVSYEPMDLATYTAELARTFRSLIERAGMLFVVECSPLPEAIYVDREMWEKIVLNLLSNAFKFTLAGTITVQLQWLENKVELTVADTGVGIPAEELPRLFERFHRVENSQGRSFEGSGIGLSLVQELVKLHGGTIAVASTFGQGSCFTVTIPAGTAHLPSERIRASRTLISTALGAIPYVEEAQRWLSPEGDLSLPTQDGNPTNLNPEANPSTQSKILLADDNADMLEYIRRLLNVSYTVQTVADGIAALNAIHSNPPDLVLTDVMMPGMDGFELLRSLRSNPTTQDIPIILLSARAGEESRIEGLEAGADDYLVKPFSARELIARVESTLKLAQLRRTARLREQALQLETQVVRANLEQVLSSLRDGFLTLDRHWRYTYINDRQLEIIKMSREAVMGKNVWEVFPDIVGTEIYQHLQQAMNQRVAVQFESYYGPLDGWFAHWVYPTPEGIAILVADITDRKRAEVEQQKLIAMINNSPDFIGLASLDGQGQYLNPAGRTLIGFDLSEQIQLLRIIDCFFPEDQGFVQEHILATTLRDGLWRGEYRFRHYQTGAAIVVDYHVFVVRDPETGEPIGYGTVTRDIRERKQSEQEREQLLVQAQAARERSEAANRVKDEFLAVLSHELRTPMNPILGWARLLKEGKLNATKTTDAIAAIERNAKLQVQLIDDLLDISRILGGKLSLNVMPVDLSMVILAALETVRLAAEAKSLQIQTTFSPDVGTVVGDAGRLQQVVWNLLSNAVKFTPQGGQITVTLTQTRTHAQLQVTDTGKGINIDFVPYVFDRFRQEDGATTRKFGGLGLGLAIVRQIVELHGGRVAAYSPGEGQGATFTVQIPLAPRLSELPTLEPSSDLTNDLSGIRILVVDDEADSREFVAFVLEQANAIVTAVASGADALQAIAQSIPHIVVSDIGMPEMDGYMLMRQIRALPPQLGGRIPAIALTAYAGEVHEQQAIAAGFQHHVAKPIEPDVLVAIVVQLITNYSIISRKGLNTVCQEIQIMEDQQPDQAPWGRERLTLNRGRNSPSDQEITGE